MHKTLAHCKRTALLILGFALATGFSTSSIALPMTDLIGLYTFDSADATDTSGMGNHGTVGAGVGFSAAGQGVDGGIAGVFSTVLGNSNAISVPIDIRASLMPELTMGAWVKPSSNGQGGVGKVLSHDNGGFDRTLGIDTRGSNPGTGYAMFNGTGVLDSPSGLLQLDEWVFIVARYDGITARLTVDNNHYSTSDNTDFDIGFSNLFIGANPGFNEDFNGLIDNVFVYSRNLSDTELDDIRRNGVLSTSIPEPTALLLLLAGAVFLLSQRQTRTASFRPTI